METHEWLERPVSRIRPAALSRILAWMHDQPVEILVHVQAATRVTVVATSRTIVLAPAATLRELLIASMLLDWPKRSDEVLNLSRPILRKAKLIELAQDRLTARFPGYVRQDRMPLMARSLDLRHRSARAKDVHLERPIRPSSGPSHWQSAGARWILSDCKLEGISDPLQELTDRIRAGEIPLETLPDFPDVPFFVAEIRVGARGTGLADEERLARVGVISDIVIRIARCMRQRGEGVEELAPPEVSSHVGVDLLQDRLAEARAALRAGQVFPVFAEAAEPPHRFQPERYLAGVYFDLDGLVHSGKFGTRTSPRFVASLLRAYQELGIRTFARAYVDRLVETRGRPVLLRLEFVLQAGDGPWTDAIWERLESVLAHATRIEGQPGHFTPLGLSRMASEFRALVKPESNTRLILAHTEGFYREHPAHAANADERFAAAMDRMAARLDKQVGPISSTAFLFPKSLVEKLDRRGHLRSGCFGERE